MQSLRQSSIPSMFDSGKLIIAWLSGLTMIATVCAQADKYCYTEPLQYTITLTSSTNNSTLKTFNSFTTPV
ncbi:hypothetical protein V1509DRAFT_616481 [Lipomyces kononenkoae]